MEVPAALFPGQTQPMVCVLELVRTIQPLPLPPFESSDPARVTTTPSGLQIEVLREGSGAAPRMGQEVTVHYAGWLTDGTSFDSSYKRGEPSAFRLGEVIAGWNEGLALMKEGGLARLTIPGKLAYGKRGSPPKIGPDATLVFVVELIRVSP
jgi:FKBP-type peptidyl-prolyl cis-trans isomerase